MLSTAAASRPYVEQFGQLALLDPRLVEGLLLDAPGGLLLLPLGRDRVPAVVDGGCLLNHPQSDLPVLTVDLLELPEALLMQGEHIAIFLFGVVGLLGLDDLVEEELVVGGDLGEVLLGAVVVGALVALVEEGHVEGGSLVQPRLLRNYQLDPLQVLLVVLLLVQGGVQPVVERPVVIEGFRHLHTLLFYYYKLMAQSSSQQNHIQQPHFTTIGPHQQDHPTLSLPFQPLNPPTTRQSLIDLPQNKVQYK